jgi:hypothetical protein
LESKIMTCQITINPIFTDHPNYACKWRIERPGSSKDASARISTGEIKAAEFNSNQVSFIAEEITKLCKIEARRRGKALSLKFDFDTVYGEEITNNAIDLFRLYGLLSVKLNPLIIQMTAPKMNSC